MNHKASSLFVSVCQLTSSNSVSQNTNAIESLVSSVDGEIDLICFPENSLYFRLDKEEVPPRLTLEDPQLERLSRLALRRKVSIHLGSIPLYENGHLYNASILIDQDGGRRVTYKKIHLFDVDVEGARPQRESETFAAGVETSTFSIKGWKFGSSICYDVRFSELYSRYAREAVDVILIPSAFLVETGRAHWDILIRARAIESQAYVLAAAQGGTHRGASGSTRATYGHSLIVDPWGQVIAEADADAQDAKSRVLKAELRMDRIESVRKQIPMKNHRKL